MKGELVETEWRELRQARFVEITVLERVHGRLVKKSLKSVTPRGQNIFESQLSQHTVRRFELM